MPDFFIRRPIFAWVVALLISLMGLLAIPSLPIAQYPDIAPPVITLRTTYPGASAQDTEEAVTAVIEKEINGAPGLMYMSATSSSDGAVEIAATFTQGTDPDIAAVEVQNRLKIVESRLPESVRREGVFVEKSSNNIQAMISLSSTGSLNDTELGEWASARIIPELKRVKGVGRVELFGAEKLEALGLTPTDIVNAVAAQSERIIIGDIGGAAVPESAPINAGVVAEDAFRTPEEFASIALRTLSDGSSVKLGDVARVELGANSYAFFSRCNGQTATGMAIKMAPGSNAVETMGLLKAKMDELSRDFPPGVSYQIPYETTHFVEISIRKVISTLLEAVLLVFLVMFLFLQNFRATLIPTLVVPVALLGTFAVMWLSGFSINMLTMFGMVLSIGILVDDAIVVVENVERIMMEEGLDARRATVKAMKQIGGAIVGITAVLVAVFVPMAFFSGAVGNIYRQFAVTLIVSISFSAFLALSLTPALCAAMLKPSSVEHQEKKGFFGWFNRTIHRSTDRYGRAISGMIRRPVRSLFLYALIIAGAGYLYLTLPTSFLPEEDQGNFMAMVSLPAGTLQKETSVRLREVEDYLMRHEPVEHVYSVGGFSFMGSGTNMAMLFVGLKNWDERPGENSAVQAIIDRVNARFAGDGQMMVMALNMPALPELGNSSGFDFRLQDKGGLGYARMAEARDELLARANADPNLAGVYFSGQADTPRLHVSIDREKAFSMGVPIAEISNSLAVMFGSSYVGDFMHDSQVRRIMVQADGKSRLNGNDIEDLHVRNDQGKLLPLSSFVRLDWTAGPPQLTRYNNYPSFTINGSSAPGKSSGDAMNALEQITASLPQGVGFEWTGQSYEEKLAGSQATLLFGLSILIVFLVLAALYESWSIPLAVILVVPLGLLGALLAVFLRDMPNDIYFKVGLITTIGLSAKNAILIVEFAVIEMERGKTLMEATLSAARIRLRPILMTSFAFILGCVPLALASGSGAYSRNIIGIVVIAGMTMATVVGIFLIPCSFYFIMKLFRVRIARKTVETEDPDEIIARKHLFHEAHESLKG